jgi:hypothetical protein
MMGKIFTKISLRAYNENQITEADDDKPKISDGSQLPGINFDNKG